jgi:hypothetical protein
MKKALRKIAVVSNQTSVWLVAIVALSTVYCLLSTPVSARTTPDDILRDQQEAYNSKLKTYSPANQDKVAAFQQKITNLNKAQTDILEARMIRQGEILNEYVFRQGIEERQADGINRDLSDPVENARYWLTYAHEAVAFQAAKHYVLNLTGEANIKANINSQITRLANDVDILAGKVDKSQKIIETLVSK